MNNNSLNAIVKCKMTSNVVGLMKTATTIGGALFCSHNNSFFIKLTSYHAQGLAESIRLNYNPKFFEYTCDEQET
jgi:hypothetical protein